MTPKEKAEELYKTMYVQHSNIYPSTAKQCALLTVNYMKSIFDGLHKPEYCAFDCIGERRFTFEGEHPDHMTGLDMMEYLEEVEQELKKL